MYQNQERLALTGVWFKAKNKTEVYKVLTTEGGVCLSPQKEWNFNISETSL